MISYVSTNQIICGKFVLVQKNQHIFCCYPSPPPSPPHPHLSPERYQPTQDNFKNTHTSSPWQSSSGNRITTSQRPQRPALTLATCSSPEHFLCSQYVKTDDCTGREGIIGMMNVHNRGGRRGRVSTATTYRVWIVTIENASRIRVLDSLARMVLSGTVHRPHLSAGDPLDASLMSRSVSRVRWHPSAKSCCKGSSKSCCCLSPKTDKPSSGA